MDMGQGTSCPQDESLAKRQLPFFGHPRWSLETATAQKTARQGSGDQRQRYDMNNCSAAKAGQGALPQAVPDSLDLEGKRSRLMVARSGDSFHYPRRLVALPTCAFHDVDVAVNAVAVFDSPRGCDQCRSGWCFADICAYWPPKLLGRKSKARCIVPLWAHSLRMNVNFANSDIFLRGYVAAARREGAAAGTSARSF